jgi:hypothetical protein
VDEYIVREEEESTISTGNGTQVHKTWTTSLEEIYWTLDEEDQLTIAELIGTGMENLIADTHFDIYEDYATGASFAVPYGSAVTYQDEFFHIEMEYSYLAFLPVNTSSFLEAAQSLTVLGENVLAQYPGATLALNFEDEYEIDEYDEYISNFVFREVRVDGQSYLLIVGGEVMGADLAFLMLICPLPREMEKDALSEFLKLALATEIISFSGHY